MLDFTFENQGNNAYLVYKLKEGNSIDSLALGMLTNNSISGLAPTTFTQLDEDLFLKFNITHKVSLKQYFSGSVSKKNLLSVFNGILKAFRVADEYMIEMSSIVMDEEYIYIDVSTQQTDVICLPVEGEDHDVDMKEFFKKILYNAKFDSNENCSYVASIMNYLNGSSAFCIDDFAKVLEIQTDAPTQKPAEKTQPQVRQNAPQPVAPPIYTPPERAVQPQRIVPKPQGVPPVAPPVEQKSATGNEKKMSMMYLLQHYNKENAAIYKSQKDGRNAGGEEAKKKKKDNDKSKKKHGKQASEISFAIPGQEIPFSMPVGVSQPQQPVLQQMHPVQMQQPANYVQQQPVCQPVQKSVQKSSQQSHMEPANVNFGQTTLLGTVKIGETTVLSAVVEKSQKYPYLVRVKTGERIPVNKPVFRIGKEKSYVDYFVGDNTAVSRSHANIIAKDGAYYVVDTNSTNHTYVNGNMIQSNTEVPIENGTAITFANEHFEFKII